MPPLPIAARIPCVSGPLSAIEAEALVLPWFDDDTTANVPGLEVASDGEVTRALQSREFSAKPFEMLVVGLSGWPARRAILIGAGPRTAFGTTVARRLATTAGLAARTRRIGHLAFVCRLPSAPADASRWTALAQAIAEGLVLSEFHSGSLKTAEPAPPLPRWTVVADAAPSDVAPALLRGQVLGESSNLAREMANAPGNQLTPRSFATRASEIAVEGGVRAEVLEPAQLKALGMGMLLGVAQGSAEPAQLVVLRYDPPGVTAGPVLGLVGKGVTFDTGGISIKPADLMDRMKDDMSGGAAVACAMRAIGLLGAPIRVIGLIPIAENMPSGTAIRPGDVLTSAEGKTVEIINTDAEGRLILGDALWYARQLGATHLVDVATLTGAIVVALGKITSGVFGTPDAWVDQVRKTGDAAGDPMWPLPIFDEYREQLKSEIADFANTGGRPAGSITAALFLKEFTGNLPWVHIDIAGTAWAEETRPYQPKGATGVAARTLARLAMDAAEWSGRL